MSLNQLLVAALQEDRRRHAEAVHRARATAGRRATGPDPIADVTLRLARPEDGDALEQLAGALAAREQVLVADVGGRVVGACSVDGTTRFRSAADPLIEDLLHLRARQLRRFRRSRALAPAVPDGC